MVPLLQVNVAAEYESIYLLGRTVIDGSRLLYNFMFMYYASCCSCNNNTDLIPPNLEDACLLQSSKEKESVG